MGRRSFSREFKLEAVRLVRERGVTVAQAARDLDLHQNMLRNWVRDFSADPAQDFPGQGQMQRMPCSAMNRWHCSLVYWLPRSELQPLALGQRLGQRGHGELLLLAQDRADCSQGLPVTGPGQGRRVSTTSSGSITLDDGIRRWAMSTQWQFEEQMLISLGGCLPNR